MFCVVFARRCDHCRSLQHANLAEQWSADLVVDELKDHGDAIILIQGLLEFVTVAPLDEPRWGDVNVSVG